MLSSYMKLRRGGEGILCPYCQTRYGITWDTEYGDPMEGDHEVKCLTCDKKFFIETVVENRVLPIKDKPEQL